MSVNLALLDYHVRDHVAELLREAEHERLVAQAVGNGWSIRAHAAGLLRVAADRLEGQPRRRTADATV
jgi:hypothetical protein